jgi:mitochondrial import inner membrane translocase subunit TIM16
MAYVKVLANIIIQGTAVFGKAFMQAYANAAQNAGKGAAEGLQAVVKRGQMTREEAIEILGVTADMMKHTPEEVQEKYDKFFEANDPNNGGSFYLQSKIFRAKEFLESEDRIAAEAMMNEMKEETEGDGVKGMDGTTYTHEDDVKESSAEDVKEEDKK